MTFKAQIVPAGQKAVRLLVLRDGSTYVDRTISSPAGIPGATAAAKKVVENEFGKQTWKAGTTWNEFHASFSSGSSNRKPNAPFLTFPTRSLAESFASAAKAAGHKSVMVTAHKDKVGVLLGNMSHGEAQDLLQKLRSSRSANPVLKIPGFTLTKNSLGGWNSDGYSIEMKRIGTAASAAPDSEVLYVNGSVSKAGKNWEASIYEGVERNYPGRDVSFGKRSGGREDKIKGLTKAEAEKWLKEKLQEYARVQNPYIGFAALKKQLMKKGKTASQASALAASIGRKKYGKAEFQKMSLQGKKRAKTAKRKANRKISKKNPEVLHVEPMPGFDSPSPLQSAWQVVGLSSGKVLAKNLSRKQAQSLVERKHDEYGAKGGIMSRRFAHNPSKLRKLASSALSKTKSALRSLTPAGRRAKKAMKRLLDAQPKPSNASKARVRVEGYALQPKNAKRNPKFQKPYEYKERAIAERLKALGASKAESEHLAGHVYEQWGEKPKQETLRYMLSEFRQTQGNLKEWAQQDRDRRQSAGYIVKNPKKRNTRKKVVVSSSKKRGSANRKCNPANLASQLYEEFHGTPSTELIKITTREHVHRDLAALGELVRVKVRTHPFEKLSNQREVWLKSPDPSSARPEDIVFLCSSEDKRQLYFVGGKQYIPVESIGFTKSELRDVMLIGELLEIEYRTKKGFDRFKLTDYYHALGEEDDIRPALIYYPRDPRMEVAGGNYRVKPEGICN